MGILSHLGAVSAIRQHIQRRRGLSHTPPIFTGVLRASGLQLRGRACIKHFPAWQPPQASTALASGAGFAVGCSRRTLPTHMHLKPTSALWGDAV